MKITAKNKKQFNEMIHSYREQGFNIVTFGKKLAELEREDEFVIIEISREA